MRTRLRFYRGVNKSGNDTLKKNVANRALLAFLALAILPALLFPSALLTGLAFGLNDFCSSLQGILPIAAMLMVVLAGVLYAAGQVMGAETRARANVWATACLTGALMAVLIYIVSPPVLSSVYGQTASCTATSAMLPVRGNNQICDYPQCTCSPGCIPPSTAICTMWQRCHRTRAPCTAYCS